MSVITTAIGHLHRGLTDLTQRCDSCDGRADWRFAFRPSMKPTRAKVVYLCDGCAHALGTKPVVSGRIA